MLNTIEQAQARAEAMRASWRGESVVTPKGIAVIALYQIKRALIDMGPADVAEVTDMLVELVNEQAPVLAPLEG